MKRKKYKPVRLNKSLRTVGKIALAGAAIGVGLKVMKGFSE